MQSQYSDSKNSPGGEQGFRLGLISFLAAGIGLLAGVIAYLLYDLIALITFSTLTGVGVRAIRRRRVCAKAGPLSRSSSW